MRDRTAINHLADFIDSMTKTYGDDKTFSALIEISAAYVSRAENIKQVRLTFFTAFDAFLEMHSGAGNEFKGKSGPEIQAIMDKRLKDATKNPKGFQS